jgi:hypothetical protein
LALRRAEELEAMLTALGMLVRSLLSLMWDLDLGLRGRDDLGVSGSCCCCNCCFFCSS